MGWNGMGLNTLRWDGIEWNGMGLNTMRWNGTGQN